MTKLDSSGSRWLLVLVMLVVSSGLVTAGEEPDTSQAAASPESSGQAAQPDDGDAGHPDDSADDSDNELAGAEDEATLSEHVVVTANRTEQKKGDVPANVTVLTREDIQMTAARTADDVLRQVPGFSLTRQSSSLVSSAAVQPAVIRGIGGSAASRTLVLLDGVPINDPFGGWVNWTRVPRDSIDRIEVVRGAGSSAWGNLAMAGVINILTERPTARTLNFSAMGGQRETVNLNLFATDVYGPVGVSFSANYYDSNGYPVIRPDQRGDIDQDTTKQFETYTAKFEVPLSEKANFYFTGSYFSEQQEPGTPMQEGTIDILSFVAGADLITDKGDQWQVHVFTHDQTAQWFRSSVARDRNSESPRQDRYNPSNAVGASAVWSRNVGRHQLMSGGDYQWLDTEYTEDTVWVGDRFTSRRDIAGKQQLAGVFLQDLFEMSPKWKLTASGRVDYFRNYDGSTVFSDLDSGDLVREEDYDDHSEVVFNPNVGAVFRATPVISWRGAVYRGFRAPNPDELYRGFTSRGVITAPNPELDAERLAGIESGMEFTPHRMFGGQVTLFWNQLQDRVSSVILADAGPGGDIIEPCGVVDPDGRCRQRDNVGEAVYSGIEVDLGYRPYPFWDLGLSYFYSNAEFTGTPNQPELEGNTPRHVPSNSFVARVGYTNSKIFAASIQGRFVGERWEDDPNTRLLESFFLVDVLFSKDIAKNVQIFGAVENVFDEVYEVTRSSSGIAEVGAPRFVYGGVRLAF